MTARPPEITISRASSKESPPTPVQSQPSTNATARANNPTYQESFHLDGSLDVRILRRGEDFQCLEDLLQDHAYTHHEKNTDSFWSVRQLERLLTHERVLEELEYYDLTTKNLPALAERVCRGHRQVFSILCIMGKGPLIEHFFDDGISDEALPLVFCSSGKPARRHLARRDVPSLALACTKTWTIQDRKSFNDLQHRMLPAYLDLRVDPITRKQTIRHERYEETIVLPFLERAHKQSGGYGLVSQVRIHPDCHGFSRVLHPIRTDDGFALKEIIKPAKLDQSQSDREFWKEVENLKRFSGFSHPNLVTLLMTWTIKDRHYLLFPLADCDLDQYLESRELGYTSCGLPELARVQWISKQIVGMASALDRIHNPPFEFLAPEDRKYGRHGDLKPENILWYESSLDPDGILVIADLGLSALNSILSRSNVPNGTVPGTPRYRPPEYDLEQGHISRSYDVWTFGCLLLEIVCWMLGGPAARKAFSLQRMSPYITGCSSDIFFDVMCKEHGGFVMMVKSQVTQEIARLHEHPACTAFLHDLLLLIEEDMLVVLSANTVRISSARLLARVAQMHNRVLNNGHTYSQKLCRLTRPVKTFLPVDANLKQTARDNVVREILGLHRGRSQREAPLEALRDN